MKKILGILVSMLLIAVAVPAVESIKIGKIDIAIPNDSFRSMGANWIETQKLIASDGEVGDYFCMVGLDGDTAFSGKRNEINHYLPISPRCYYIGIIDNLSVNGTTYLFEAINLLSLGFDGYGDIYYSHIKHEPMHYTYIFEPNANFHGILRPHFICGVFIYYY